MRALLPALALLLVGLLAACGGGGMPEPSGQRSPTLASIEEVIAAPGAKIVFLREPSEDSPIAGRIWLATEDGRSAAALTPEGVKAAYVGFHRSANGARLYYVTSYANTAYGVGRTLWELDLTGGPARRLWSFMGGVTWNPGASLSPDGTYVAYVDSNNLRLRNLITGDDSVLLRGNRAACGAPGPGPCFAYDLAPLWSPDGKLLLVEKSYYEGSRPVVVDPFAMTPAEVPAEGPPERPADPVGPRAWSPDSRSFCGVNSYDGTGLFVASAPDWLLTDLVPQYQPSPQPSAPERYVEGCDWLGTSEIISVTVVDTRRFTRTPAATAVPYLLEVSVHHLQTHRTEVAATVEWEEPGPPIVLALSPDRAVLSRGATRPEIIDLRTGKRTSILREGDRPVAVISP